MNSLPQTSAVILQIIGAILSLITSLIVANYGYRLSQKNKSKEDAKLQIIKAAAAQDIQTYSGKNISQGERKDALNYIIYKLPMCEPPVHRLHQ